MGKFIISTRKNGEYQFSLVSSNGQIVLKSEGYIHKESCLNGVKSVIENAQNIERFDRKFSTNGKYYFNLKATNGAIIGTSELYESEAARENGIFSVQKNSQENLIEELI